MHIADVTYFLGSGTTHGVVRYRQPSAAMGPVHTVRPASVSPASGRCDMPSAEHSGQCRAFRPRGAMHAALWQRARGRGPKAWTSRAHSARGTRPCTRPRRRGAPTPATTCSASCQIQATQAIRRRRRTHRTLVLPPPPLVDIVELAAVQLAGVCQRNAWSAAEGGRGTNSRKSKKPAGEPRTCRRHWPPTEGMWHCRIC